MNLGFNIWDFTLGRKHDTPVTKLMECTISERPGINNTKLGNYFPWFLILEKFPI